jgi:diguanylate cyclase (GGDEF)-like protein/PAS domain S-box-containing protein
MSKFRVPRMTFSLGEALCVGCTCTISLLAGAGWLFNRPVLASFDPNFIPMAPATALIFLGICGAWLLQRIFPTRQGIRTLVQVAMVGMLVIVIILALRYFTGLGPDLEKILYPAPPMFGQFSSARMSPLSALGFLLAIPAFLLLTGSKPGQRTKGVSAALSLVLFVLSVLILIGYLFSAPPFYGGALTPVAVTSGFAFWFLSLALLLMAGPDIWPVRMFTGSSLRARLMRAIIPVSILIALFQGLLSTVADPWVSNPAIKVAIAAFAACSIFLFIIYQLAQNLSSEFDRGRKAEQALLQSESELRALFAGMMDVVIVMDADGRYIEIAPTDPANLFRPPDEMLGKIMHEILPKEPADIILSMVRSSIQTGQVVNGEYTLQIDGKEITFSASASRLSETTVIIVAHDITNRKRTEEALRRSESSLQAVLQSTSEGILAVSSENEVLYANERFSEIWRIPQEVMASKDDSVLIQYVLDQLSDPQNFLNQVQELYHSKEDSFDILNFKDGRIFERVSRPLLQSAGIRGRVWSFRDITERKQFEMVQNAIYRITQAAITSEGMDALYRSIHSILGELIPAENFFIGLYDPVSGLINFPYYIDQYDEAPSPIAHTQGLSGYILRTGRPLLATREIYDRLVGQGEVEPVGTAFVDWMGAPLKVEERIIGVMAVQSYTEKIHFDQEEMNLLEFVSTQVAQAIDRKRMEEEIRSLSLTDELTGLYNRRGFSLLAERELKSAHRNKRSMLLIFADVNDLKEINDTNGHAQGDLALQEVSAVLKNSLREADIIARHGGDEFVALAVDATLESADILSKRIQETLLAHNREAERPYTLSLSTGMVCYGPGTACTLNEMIAQADARMYAQKQAGKGKK